MPWLRCPTGGRLPFGTLTPCLCWAVPAPAQGQRDPSLRWGLLFWAPPTAAGVWAGPHQHPPQLPPAAATPVPAGQHSLPTLVTHHCAFVYAQVAWEHICAAGGQDVTQNFHAGCGSSARWA